MPKVDFYIITENNFNSRIQFACRLIEKAYQQKHRIFIHTANKQQAHAIDEMLWTYRDDSFLPHHLLGEGPEPTPPIQIGYDKNPEKHRDILINLSSTVPEFYAQFQRILEIVTSDTETQNDTREHFRFYRSQGLNISTHKLEKSIHG
jgi:DNA polymerase-3 subunit chi